MAYLAAGVIQLFYAGMFLLSKIAFDGGMNSFIFVFYRQAAASIFLFPFALFFGWKSAPPLTFSTFCKIFLLSFVGITMSLNICGIGLVYTSATLAAASANSLPVITFILAVLLRVETVKMRAYSGVAKMTGILICMGGVAVLAFYKGPDFHVFSHNGGILHIRAPHTKPAPQSIIIWIKGCFFMLLSNTFWALWLILQGRVLKSYPSKLHFTTLQCLLSAFQSFFIAIAVERDPREWRLGWNVRLLAVAYCGIAVTGVCYYLQAFVIEKKGPVFLSMSTPLSLIITIICSALFLGQAVSLGSLVGGLLLVAGLYCVLWGKRREHCPNVEAINDEKEGPSHCDLKQVCVDINMHDEMLK
uniref:WAT1-related protein n=1 Tax=Kalanchoe fedtschenkoi TaxID=63787 RepID=A0A7N0TV94_KALFE